MEKEEEMEIQVSPVFTEYTNGVRIKLDDIDS